MPARSLSVALLNRTIPAAGAVQPGAGSRRFTAPATRRQDPGLGLVATAARTAWRPYGMGRLLTHSSAHPGAVARPSDHPGATSARVPSSSSQDSCLAEYPVEEIPQNGQFVL